MKTNKAITFFKHHNYWLKYSKSRKLYINSYKQVRIQNLELKQYQYDKEL